MERDAVAAGAQVRRLDDDFRWPGGRRVAVVCNVAFEAWSDGRGPGIGPMGNPLPAGAVDTNARSWGNYGVTRGIDRLLRVLADEKVRASVMVSGVIAERRPATVRAIAQAGHEIVAHGYAQDVVPAALPAEEDRAQIDRTTRLLTEAAGVRPTGWISPRGTPGAGTAAALVEAGYAWHGDIFDDDRPYLQVFDHGQIVGIPLNMEVNDLPHAMRYGRSPRQYVELFTDLLDAALGPDEGAVVIDVTAHAHCYGRPAGAWAYRMVARAASRDDVWLATRDEIAKYVLGTAA